MKIIHARIIPSDLKANKLEAEVIATMDDGSTQSVFKYFDDELSFGPTEFLGKTIVFVFVFVFVFVLLRRLRREAARRVTLHKSYECPGCGHRDPMCHHTSESENCPCGKDKEVQNA